MTTQKITIHDVAKHAGVSVSTVSLALSKKGRISQKTIDKINYVIDKIGYIRNQQAATLRSTESNIIGVIVKDISNPFFAEVIAGIEELIEHQGKTLLLTQCGRHNEKIERCFQTLCSYGVDGIIIGSNLSLPSTLIERAKWANIPLAYATPAYECDDIDIIKPNNIQAAKLATEYLIKQGHHQIAYLGGTSDSLTRAERLTGFLATLAQYGLPFRNEWIIECDEKRDDPRHLACTLLSNYPQISALICHKNSIALSTFFGLLDNGRQINQDHNLSFYTNSQVTLVRFADHAESDLQYPKITSVTNSAKEIGKNAAIRILQRIEDNSLPITNIIIAAKLVPMS